MLATPAPSFTDWKNVLVTIGLKEPHVTEDLVTILGAHNFTPSTMTDESFHGYYLGASENEAGSIIAKEFSSLNPLQEFLNPIIDWEQAWQSLKTMERYILVKTNDKDVWALFALE